MATDDPATDARALVAKAADLGVTLDEDAAVSLLAYLDAMLEVGKQINLTAIRDREQAVVLHALDGLAFGKLAVHGEHVLDIGTGNGFPGVAVAALLPNASVLLMDRTGKKIRAIGTCLLTARLSGIETVQLDAAQAPALNRQLRGAFDVVTARAVASPTVCAELAAPLLRPGGHLVLWLDERTELPEKLRGFRHERTVPYDLPPPAARQRRLALLRRS